MFLTFKQRLLLGIYVFVLISIPIGTYLISQYQNTKTSAKEQSAKGPVVKTIPKSNGSGAKNLLNASQSNSPRQTASSSASTSPDLANSYGPTLSFQVVLDGRPKGNQATSMFVGIAEGALTSNPKFLLSFTVSLSAGGEYSNISLAGLNPGSEYTALLKGSAQIATSSAFTMSPAISNLNGGEPLNLLSGDLNDDNIINSADYSIAQKALGTTASSPDWNTNADFNMDGTINTFDLAIITKNMGLTGASGAWVSPVPGVASNSASLTSPPVGGPPGSGGYWIWIPN